MQAVIMTSSGNAKPRWPVWAPLAFKYDKTKALLETESLSSFFIALPPHISTVVDHKRFWPIVPDELYDKIGFWKDKQHYPGINPTWEGLNLTTTNQADSKDTTSGANRIQGASRGQWYWNLEVAKKCKYICFLVEQLPFEYFDVVRIMTIPVGGFGPIHIDKPEGEKEHSEKDFAGLTLELSNGGVGMQIKDREGNRHDVTDDAYLFLDTVPHGVPLVSHKRTIIRIYGKIEPNKLHKLIDYERAIW